MENVVLTQLTIPEVRQIFRQELMAFFAETTFPSSENVHSKWLNLAELCSYLPEKPAKQTVYTWVSNQSIPVHKKGKKIYFLKSEIDEWLASGRKKTISEIEELAIGSLISKNKRAENMRQHDFNPDNHLSGGQVVKDTINKHKSLHFVQGILLLSYPVGTGALTIAAGRLGLTLSELQKLIEDFKAMEGLKHG